MAKEIIHRYMACKPHVDSVGRNTGSATDDNKFNPDNATKHIPVSLHGTVPSGDDGLPVVKVTQGNSATETIFGKFVSITGATPMNRDSYTQAQLDAELPDIVVTVAVEGESMKFRRDPTGGAITTSDIGKGITGSGTASTANTRDRDGIVESGTVAVGTRGVIIGGNTSAGTADAPAFFRVNFRSS